MHAANERWCYTVTPSLIGCVHTQNDPWADMIYLVIFFRSISLRQPYGMPSHCQNQCWYIINILRQRQNGRRFTNERFKCIFLNENVIVLIKVSLKFVPKVQINNIAALVQIMAWRRPRGKPLSEPMMVKLAMHICVTQPQWVNWTLGNHFQLNFNQNETIFIQGKQFENVVYKIVAIVSHLQYLDIVKNGCVHNHQWNT